jgi:lipoprotein-anchoring transpeptidase ErfK/SrfK
MALASGAFTHQNPQVAASGPDAGPDTRNADTDTTQPRDSSPQSFFGPGYPPARGDADGTARVGSLTWGTWIQPKADSRSLPLGSVRPGSSIPLLQPDLIPGLGKCRSFVRVNHGYVCATRRATLDMQSDFMQAHRWTEPAPGSFPYEYAFSVGAPMLTRIPAAGENHWRIGRRDHKPLRGWAAGHDELVEESPIEPNGPVPDFLRDGGSAPSPWGKRGGIYAKRVPFGSMIAYTRAFEAEGEVWVLSTNLTIVPARGLKRFRRSTFRGVELSGKTELPLAWIRKKPRPKWRRTKSGFEPAGGSWPLRGWVALTGAEEKQGRVRYLETREPGIYIAAQDATLVEAVTKRPWEVKGDDKWIHVRVNRGTLTLYEGLRPIFTTLMSPGKDGATPYGRYRIESKHHVTTMTTEPGEPRKFWIADVPWTLYFKRPYAIHGAYWHEDFGERKSGGCVNLSLLDARRVFEWANPPLPKGWGSVQGYGMGGGTFVLVGG